MAISLTTRVLKPSTDPPPRFTSTIYCKYLWNSVLISLMQSYAPTPHSACRMHMCDIAGVTPNGVESRSYLELRRTICIHMNKFWTHSTRSKRNFQHAECHKFQHYVNPAITFPTCFQLQKFCKPDTSVWEQGVEENICNQERWSEGRLENTT
jgi:hypothetical protein